MLTSLFLSPKKLIIAIMLFLSMTLKSQNTFIENKGQLPDHVLSKTILPSGVLFLENGVFRYVFYDSNDLKKSHHNGTKKTINAHSYTVSFLKRNKNITTVFKGKSRYFENYYNVKKADWVNSVFSYESVLQKNIYKGVDMRFYEREGILKYEIFVKKQTNPNIVKLKYEGAEDLWLEEGRLFVKTSVNEIIEHAPYAYQIIDGVEKKIECNYSLKNKVLTFEFPNNYNEKYDLVIDPILEFSTYSGSFSDNFGYTATYDNFGFLYSGSTVFGPNYPTTIGAYQINYANNSGGTDMAITKYDTSGMHMIYSTYLGGSNDELPHSMIVNEFNELFVFGTTGSSDYPTTTNAFCGNFKGGPPINLSGIGVNFPIGSDLFVSKIDSEGGVLLSSTLVGGTNNDGLNTAPKLKYNYADEVRGEIEIDKNNNIYVVTSTSSTDLPSINSFQSINKGGQEGYIAKMDGNLNSIIWSSYLGGENDDAIYSLTILDNDIYVVGGTTSRTFPTTNNVYQISYQDSLKADPFITKINIIQPNISQSTYLGTDKYDQAYFVETHNKNIYVMGQTNSTGMDFIKNVEYYQKGSNQFISILSKELDTVYKSTTFGTAKGTPDISPTAFMVDYCGRIYISGWGSNLGGGLSTLNLPFTDNAFQKTTDGNDFYIMVLENNIDSLVYATFFGGSQSTEHVDGGTSRFDKKGIIYQSVCAGCNGFSDFPIKPIPGAVSELNNSTNCNNGVFKFNFTPPIVVADFVCPKVICDQTVSFYNNSTTNGDQMNYFWNFGDGNTSTQKNPSHQYLNSGQYNITLITSSLNTCNLNDTITKTIYVLGGILDTITDVKKCLNNTVQIGIATNSTNTTYEWTPAIGLNAYNIPNPVCSLNTTQQYQLIISQDNCKDTLIQTIRVADYFLNTSQDTSYCKDSLMISADYLFFDGAFHWSNYNSDTLGVDNELYVYDAGVYIAVVNDGLCIQKDTVSINYNNIDVDILGDTGVCIGDSVFLKAQVSSANPIISYYWTPQEGFYNQDSSTVANLLQNSTHYFLEVTDVDGCVARDSIDINVLEYPKIDSLWSNKDTIYKGQDIQLNIITSYNYNWYDFELELPNIQTSPNNSRCYLVETLNTENCVTLDSICIIVLDVFCEEDNIIIPTAFSPNNDQLNDKYLITDKDQIITSFKIEIFNRLGQQVFSTNDKNISWDGKYKGVLLSPQVLDFYLEIECLENKKLFKKGNITILR